MPRVNGYVLSGVCSTVTVLWADGCTARSLDLDGVD